MSNLTDLEIHKTRISYMQTFAQYGVDFKEAISIAEDYLKNPYSRSNVPSPDNPDLSDFEINRLRAENERLRKEVGEVKNFDFPQEELGKRAEKVSDIDFSEIKQRISEEYKSGSDEILINRPKHKKTPTQEITPDFGPMANAGGLKENKKGSSDEPDIPNKEDLRVSKDLEDQRTVGGKIPLRYEDRVKLAEQQSNQPQQNQRVERPADMKTDERGYGESGGALPPGMK